MRRLFVGRIPDGKVVGESESELAADPWLEQAQPPGVKTRFGRQAREGVRARPRAVGRASHPPEARSIFKLRNSARDIDAEAVERGDALESLRAAVDHDASRRNHGAV